MQTTILLIIGIILVISVAGYLILSHTIYKVTATQYWKPGKIFHRDIEKLQEEFHRNELHTKAYKLIINISLETRKAGQKLLNEVNDLIQQRSEKHTIRKEDMQLITSISSVIDELHTTSGASLKWLIQSDETKINRYGNQLENSLNNMLHAAQLLLNASDIQTNDPEWLLMVRDNIDVQYQEILKIHSLAIDEFQTMFSRINPS
jgi:hypothetical protein